MFCPNCAHALAHFPPVTCSACGTPHWDNAKPCSGALVTHEGEVLLVRRALEPWKGLWDIPGGFCDDREHPIDAAIREVREETGLDVTVVGFVGIWMDTYGRAGPNLPEVGTLNIYYHADLAGPARGRPDPTEVSEMAWFSPGRLPAAGQIAFPAQQVPVLATWEQTVRSGTSRRSALPDAPGGGPGAGAQGR